tara:strand:- start:78 stop:371 length:294 start_codon:yes stop_codon:yes gene_type:complete
LAEIYLFLPEGFCPIHLYRNVAATGVFRVLHKVPENPTVVFPGPVGVLDNRLDRFVLVLVPATVASRVAVVVWAKAGVVETSSLLEVQELNLGEMEI